MSGILDKKSRIIDFVITDNGRSQIANGDIRYKFATFSDKSILYTKDHEISQIKKSDVSNAEFYYLPLEVNSINKDKINPEVDLFNIGKRTISTDGEETISSAIENFLQSDTTTGQFKKFKILRTKNILDKGESLNFIEPVTNNNNFNLSINPELYPTIKQLQVNKNDLPVVALDKRLSFKTNFLFMPPVDISGSSLYSNENFKNIDDLDEENTTSFLLTSYSSMKNKTSEIQTRDREILNIIETMSKDKNLYKKIYDLDNPTENDSFIFEIHEIEESESSAELSRLHFIKIGDFYDNTTASLKKVYLAGKLLNTREDTSDLDVLFMFNNGIVNLESDREFTFSSYFSFINLFTIVIE
tara:strand:+ start:1057 stop:2130 length:1074 start_codon:yes stop_codon:yes gene_type:complete